MALYQAYLPISATETIGPVTNSRTVAILHPDMHVGSETGHVDAGRARITQRQADRDAYLPTHRFLSNMYLRNRLNYDLSTRDIYDNLGNISYNRRLISQVTAWDDIVYNDNTYVAGQDVLVRIA